MNSLSVVKWDQATAQKFPDMKTEGVANILSDALLDSGVEAPLSTDLEKAAALAFHRLFTSIAKYTQDHHAEWATLSAKQRAQRVPIKILPHDGYGCLHHLISKGGLNVPPGWTVDVITKASGTFNSDGHAYIDLTLVFMQIVGDLRDSSDEKRLINFRLAKNVGTRGQVYTLSVKGSGLFLLQGNTDYALPSKLRTRQVNSSFKDKAPTELQFFVGAMKSPFALLQSLAEVSLKLNMVGQQLRPNVEAIIHFLDVLDNNKIRVRGFTFTRYMDFRHLRVKGIDVRQDFLKSLFLIYEAAKGNKQNFRNNGLKTYLGVSAETRFEDEGLQQILDSEYQSFEVKHRSDEAKVFRKRAKSISNIHSIRLMKTAIEKRSRKSRHYMTALQFTVPRVVDRNKLGLDPQGANYLRDHCLKVRFSVFNKFLQDSKIKSLSDLIRYLCPDHDLNTFRQNLDRLFRRVLEGYDYFYWVGMSWSSVVLPDDCSKFLQRVRSEVPEKVGHLLALWASPLAANSADMHSLTNLVMRVYYPQEWSQFKEDGAIDLNVLKETEKKAALISKKVLDRYGVNIKYPRAFHITVSDAFYSSTLDNLQSLQGLSSMHTEDQRKLTKQAQKVIESLNTLRSPNNWNAVALTMRSRQSTLVL